MNTNEKLLALTANMPCKQINLPVILPDDMQEREKIFMAGGFICDGGSAPEKPYLQRYYAGTFRDNKDLWIHRFLSGDSERHLHSHPFSFQSIILHGGYAEEKIDRVTKEKYVAHHSSVNVDIDKFGRILARMHHGIEQARPWSTDIPEMMRHVDVFDWHRIESVQNETWTALIVDADRLANWCFMDDSGEIEYVKSSPRDWWKQYGKRGDNPGDA